MTDLQRQNKRIAEEWRSCVVSSQKWYKVNNQAGAHFEAVQGEAGGYFVTSDVLQRRCYMKPAKTLSGTRDHRINRERARAAREKIAADLAHDLHLPVPPVILHRREGEDVTSSRQVSISLVMYPKQWPWAQVSGLSLEEESPITAAMAKVLSLASGMYVFDTWLDQRDHEFSPHNIVWGYESGALEQSELIFLDFAHSLGSDGGDEFPNDWSGGGWKPVCKAGFPALLRRHLDGKRIENVVRAIEHLSEDEIVNVVERVPKDFLPPDQADTMIEGLLGRRICLRSTFADLLPN